MRTKLSNAQLLLKAIVTQDYKQIDRAASALNRISELEIMSRRYDLEGVGAAYSALIGTCVHCHTFVRDARQASIENLKLR